MKKSFITLFIILAGIFSQSFAAVDQEIYEDYMDIISGNCVIGDYQDAVKYLDKLITLDPQNKDFKKLKDLLYQLGTKNQRSFITGYNADLDKAFAYIKQGDRVSAGNILKDATKSGNFWVYSYLGDFYRENRDYPQAVAAYFNAYQLEPSFTQALLSIAVCYLEAGQYEAVQEPIKRFIYFNQQCDLAYAIRAKAYLNMRQLNDAETEIVTALALNNDEEYQLIHAIILYRKGNYAKAINILTKLSETLQTSDVFKFLGLSYLGKKEYSNAMLNLDKAIILTNDDKELNQKYNETRELIKNINVTKLQEEERQEVKNIYEEKPAQKTLEKENPTPVPIPEIKEETQDSDNDKNNKKSKKKKKKH